MEFSLVIVKNKKLKIPVLYRALKKYGCRNFEVSLLDSYLNPNQLNEREIYWIKYFHTYIGWNDSRGYNMTTGGDNCENLHTKESLEKAKAARALRYNGDPYGQMNTPEAREKAIRTNLSNHNGVLSFNTPEAIANNRRVHEELYDGDCMGQCHTPEAYQKRTETMLKRYGVVSFTDQMNNSEVYERLKAERGGDYMTYCHTPEAREKAVKTKRDTYGDIVKWLNEPDAIFNRRISFWFTFSNGYYESSDGTELDYYHKCTNNHIQFMIDNIDILQCDSRWTKFHELFYKFIINEHTEYLNKE